jgi:hypothetical protein
VPEFWEPRHSLKERAKASDLGAIIHLFGQAGALSGGDLCRSMLRVIRLVDLTS